MKNSLFILSIVFSLSISCVQIRCIAKENTSLCNKMQILDSIKYIYGLPAERKIDLYEIPAEDDMYPYGDSICRKIILEHGNEIIPCLIEKIKDTTASAMILIEWDDGKNLYFTVSDIAILLLPYAVKKNLKIEMDITELLVDEFYEEVYGRCYGFVLERLKDIFVFSKDIYKNRIRFYNRVKRWYEKEKDNWYFDTERCEGAEYYRLHD